MCVYSIILLYMCDEARGGGGGPGAWPPPLEMLKGTDHVGTFMGLKCVVYYANYRSGNQSSKIQVVP